VLRVGDGFELVRHVTDLPFPIVLRRVAQILGLDGGGVVVVPRAATPVMAAAATQPKPDHASSTAQIERILSRYKVVTAEGAVARYLAARGLADVLVDLPQSIHEHPALPYYEDGKKVGEYPAMVAEVRSQDGALVCLHRTYLRENGDGKAPVSQPKKLTRVSADAKTVGAAVRLYTASSHVALAEGIESALAVKLIWRWPTWACLSANGLQSIELPEAITAVRIFGDNDAAGIYAATYSSNWLRGEGRCVEWLCAKEEGMDALDVWNATHGRGVPQ